LWGCASRYLAGCTFGAGCFFVCHRIRRNGGKKGMAGKSWVANLCKVLGVDEKELEKH